MTRRNPIPRNRRERQQRRQAYSEIVVLRKKALGLNTASKRGLVQREAVLHWFPSLLGRKGKRGDYYPRPYDRMPWEVRFLTEKGRVWITVRDSRTRVQIAQYMSEIGTYKLTERIEGLEPFKRRSFQAGGKRYAFITDPAVIAELESADELPIEGLYREIGTP